MKSEWYIINVEWEKREEGGSEYKGRGKWTRGRRVTDVDDKFCMKKMDLAERDEFESKHSVISSLAFSAQ